MTLKLTPLFNNSTLYFILFDGFYFIHKNTIITLQDFEENKNATEKLISVSEPELDKNNEPYSIPFKKYIIWQNNFINEVISKNDIKGILNPYV